MEYIFLWDGKDSIICLDDRGNEVWKNRFAGLLPKKLSASTVGDIILLVTPQATLGFDLNGSESFRIFGDFRDGLALDNSAFFLLDGDGKCRFYVNSTHFSHDCETDEPIERMIGAGKEVFLFGRSKIFLCNSAGAIISKLPLEAEMVNLFQNNCQPDVLIASKNGDLILISPVGEELYRNRLEKTANLACFHHSEDALFSAMENAKECSIFQNRTNHKIRVALNSPPKTICYHQKGVILGTEIDELLLISIQGKILGKYSFPDRILHVFPATQGKTINLLAENMFCSIEFSESVPDQGISKPNGP